MSRFNNPDPFVLVENKGQFVKVVFGYLDVLGFSDAVLRAKDPQEILNLLSFLDPQVHYPYEIPIQRRMVSDSILLWSEGEESLFPILDLMGSLQHSLLTKGFLSRGTVLIDDHLEVRQIKLDSKGQEYQGDYLFISKALIKAYRSEQKLANHPIIKMIDIPEAVIGRNSKKWSGRRPLFDANGIVNHYYWSHELDAVNFNSHPEDLKQASQQQLADLCFYNAILQLKAFKAFILKGIEIGCAESNENIIAKWEFLKAVHNSYIKSCLLNWSDSKKKAVLAELVI